MSLKSFRDQLGGSGPYLRAKDLEDGREVIIQPWVYEGREVNFLHYFEAWVWENKKLNKKKPVRVSADEWEQGVDTSEYDFSTSVNTFNGKTTTDGFKPVLAFLFKDIETKEIKLASFSQVTLVQALIKYLDPEDKFYDEDIANKIIVIGKESERKWAVSVKDDKKNVGDTFEDALANLEFSWEEYLRCEDPFTTNSYQDLLDVRGDSPKKKAKPSSKKKKTDEEEDIEQAWSLVKTPKGTPLGKLSKDDLKEMVNILKSKNQTGTLLYKAATAGLKEFEANESIPLEDDEEIPF